MKFSKLAGVLFGAFGVVSCASNPDRKSAPVAVDPALRGHPYANFIMTLKSLCKTDRDILLGDSNHSDPVIAELTSNRQVLAAMKECDRPFALERGIEENQGYPVPRYKADPQKLADSIAVIQSFLKEGVLNPIIVNGMWDAPTDEAFSKFLSGMQERTGWNQDPPGIYSPEFGAVLRAGGAYGHVQRIF